MLEIPEIFSGQLKKNSLLFPIILEVIVETVRDVYHRYCRLPECSQDCRRVCDWRKCCQVILKHEGKYGNYELDANRIKRVILETKGGLHIAGCLNAIRIKRTVRDVYCRLPEC